MRNKDDLPETPDWQLPESRPWDERSCTEGCVCETTQHALFMHGGADAYLVPPNIELGAE